VPKILKTGVAIPEDVASKLDRIIKEFNMPSRSYALTRAAIEFVSERVWAIGEGEVLAGAINILYDHTLHDLPEKLTDIQHNFMDIIRSTVHVHIDKKRCLEVILVYGRAERIKELAKMIEKQRGVTYIKYSLTVI